MEPNIAMDTREYLSVMGSPLKVRAARPWGCGAPQGGLCQHQGLGQGPPSPGSPLLPAVNSSTHPQNFSKVTSATKLTCPWPDIIPGASRKIFGATEEKRNKV